jgi:hypothetical protein
VTSSDVSHSLSKDFNAIEEIMHRVLCLKNSLVPDDSIAAANASVVVSVFQGKAMFVYLIK